MLKQVLYWFTGDYTLDIDPVQLEDDATFQCQVGAADGVAPIRSRDAILTVHVPPERPIIINGNTLRTTEDREVEIKCVSRGGKPAAEVREIQCHQCDLVCKSKLMTFVGLYGLPSPISLLRSPPCLSWVCLGFAQLTGSVEASRRGCTN